MDELGAAPLSAEGSAIDVERLALAIAAAGVHVDVRDPLVRTEPCASCARGVRVIAREYDRLLPASAEAATLGEPHE